MLIKSNKKVGPSVLVKVWLHEKASDYVDAIASMLARVTSLAHPPGPHPVVAGTLFNMHDIDGKVHNCVLACITSRIVTLPRLDVCVWDQEDLILVNESRNSEFYLDAAKIACLLSQHNHLPIEAVGVSATSYDLGKEVWQEITTQSRTWMDGAGQGSNTEKQYMWTQDLGSWCFPEMSETFSGP